MGRGKKLERLVKELRDEVRDLAHPHRGRDDEPVLDLSELTGQELDRAEELLRRVVNGPPPPVGFRGEEIGWWEDTPALTEEEKRELMALLQKVERRGRRTGLGSG